MIQFGIALSQRRTEAFSEGCLRTLGGSFLALLLQAEDAGLPERSGFDIIELIANATLVSKLVLVCLAVMSIASWSVILYKVLAFQRSERQSTSFLEVFRKSNKFSEVQTVCRSLGASPLVGLFQAGYSELTAQLRHQGGQVTESGPQPSGGGPRPILKSVAALDRALLRASAVELNKLESRISFLASTASIAPFIGLFGTVWGIIAAFQEIGATGSTNLGVVAPGIAEALVATALGLVAAIPAVYAYNHLSNRVKLFASEMDDFSMEFLNIAERNFT